MSSWREVRIKDLGRVVTGGTPRSGESGSWGNHIDFVTPTDQMEGRREHKIARRLSREGAYQLSARVIPPGSTCFTCIGATIGKTSLTTRPAVTNQQINSVIPDPMSADHSFVYYLLTCYADDIARVASGSATPIVNKSQFENARLPVPDIKSQRSIGRLLSALDDKIAVNDRAIHLIYELVQRMWEHAAGRAEGGATVANIADISKGLSYKGTGLGSGTPLVNLGNFSPDGRFSASGLKYYAGEAKDRHRISRGELALANTDLTQRRDILGQPLLVPRDLEEALFTHHVFAVRPREGVSSGDMLWLYGAFRDRRFRDRAITYATGTTVLALPKDAILEYELPWPSATVRRDWTQQARTLLDLAGAYTSENARLAGLRDTLLPKLMSGEVRVRGAEAGEVKSDRQR